MQRKGWKLWMIVAAVAVVVVSLWFVHHRRDRREAAERETHYEATLTEYSANVKPGMPREQVEHYLRDEGKPFRQMCCVANFRHQYVSLERAGWDDLVKIAEESAPFVCAENNVYIAFEFNPQVTRRAIPGERFRHPEEGFGFPSTRRLPVISGGKSRFHSLRTRISLRFQIIRKKFFAWASSGNILSSARNSRECTHLRLPRSLTGCFRCSISWNKMYSTA